MAHSGVGPEEDQRGCDPPLSGGLECRVTMMLPRPGPRKHPKVRTLLSSPCVTEVTGFPVQFRRLLSRELARHNNGNQTLNQTCPPRAPLPPLPPLRPPADENPMGLVAAGLGNRAPSLPCPLAQPPRPASCTGLGLLWSQHRAPGQPAASLDWRAARGYVARPGVSEFPRAFPLSPYAPAPRRLAALPLASPRPYPGRDLRGGVRAPGRSAASRAPDPASPPRTAIASLYSLFLRLSGRGPGQQRPRDHRGDGVFDPFFIGYLLERWSGPQYRQPAPHK